MYIHTRGGYNKIQRTQIAFVKDNWFLFTLYIRLVIHVFTTPIDIYKSKILIETKIYEKIFYILFVFNSVFRLH